MSKTTEIPKLTVGQYIELAPELIEEHDLLEALPPIAKDDPEVLKIADSIAQVGLLHPLLITPKGKLVDGRRRIRGAKRRQLERVPCRVVDDAKAAEIIMAALKDRAHMNKGQVAFTLCPVLEPSFLAAHARKMANLGQKAPEADSLGFGTAEELPKAVEEWADSLKISTDTLQLAYRIYRIFKSDKTKRTLTEDGKFTEKNVTFEDFYLPRMFRADKPYSLQGVIAGITFELDKEKSGGKKPKGGKPSKVEEKLKKFKETFKTLDSRVSYWSKFDEETKEAALEPLDKSLEAMPDDLLDSMVKKFNAEKRRRAADKKEGN